MTKLGQVTWANPEMKAKCKDCRHFKHDPNKPLLGKCALVKAHTKKAGVSFDGKIAIACSKFER
jgi:hypothetical protein